MQFEFSNEWLDHEAFYNENIEVIFSDEKTFFIGSKTCEKANIGKVSLSYQKYLKNNI